MVLETTPTISGTTEGLLMQGREELDLRKNECVANMGTIHVVTHSFVAVCNEEANERGG